LKPRLRKERRNRRRPRLPRKSRRRRRRASMRSMARRNTVSSETHKLGIEYKKIDNWPMWYQQVLKKAEMIEYCTDVSGCYVLRPWSYSIWEKLQAELDMHFKKV
jgi:hypothetical protein